MSRPSWQLGSSLEPHVQRQILAAYVHRFTGEHTPQWVTNADGYVPKPTAPTDAQWLRRNAFAVTAAGELDRRVKHCRSHDGADFSA